MSNSRMKSGKVRKISPTAVSADRYNFIQLSETEPDLGVPAQAGSVLVSTTAGVRSWTTSLTIPTLTVNELQTDGISISDNNITTTRTNDNLVLSASGSGQIIIQGTLSATTSITAPSMVTNTISSADSSAIQIDDAVNISGELSVDSIDVNEISSGDSTAIQINDAVNISGTLSANILDVNEISSGDSTAIQINDGVNISGTLNANTLVTTTISSEDSTAVQIVDGINVTGTVRLGGLQYPSGDLGIAGQVLSSDGLGNIEFATLTGGGASNVAADTVTFTGFGSNNIVIADANISVDLAGVVIYGSVDDSQAIGSGAGAFDSFAYTDIDGAFYIAATLDNDNVDYGTASISVASNGTDAFVSSGGGVNTGNATQLDYSSNFASPNVNLLGTGYSSDNTASYLRIGLSDSITTSTTVSPAMAIKNTVTVSATAITDNTAAGETVGVTTAAKIMDQFTGYTDDSTVAYDSAFYLAVSKDEISGEVGTAMISLVQDGTDAFTSTHGVTASGSHANQPTYSASLADLDGDSTNETVRVFATGATANSSISYHRINLGNATTASGTLPGGTVYAAEAYINTVVNANVQVGESQNIGINEKPADVFLPGAINSAFYFAVTKDEVSGQVGTAEISLMHDGTDAYVSSGNVCQSGSNPQVTFGADITNSKVRLTTQGTSNQNSIRYYRVGLGTSTTAATSGNVGTLVQTGLGSTTTTLDSWSAATYRAAKYYVSATSANGEIQNMCVRLFHVNGTSYINIYNNQFSGNNELVTLTTDISSGSVRLRAICNFNTAVRMYRIRLGDSEAGSNSTYTGIVGSTSVSSTSGENIDTFAMDDYNGVHYIVGISNTTLNTAAMYDLFVVHDGVDAYIASNYAASDETNPLNFTATVVGGDVVIKAATFNGTSYTVSAYRTHLERESAGYRVVDSWSKSIYRGAKYYLHIDSTDIADQQNIEALVTHDGTNPYIVTYNPITNAATPLMDFEVEITGSTFRLLAKNPREKNFVVRAYRVLLTDTQTNVATTYNRVVAQTSVGSGAQAIDTFASNAVTGAHYVVVSYNATEGTSETSEVFVVTDGSDAYVSSHGVSSKNTPQLTFTAGYSSGTVTLYADSSSGSDTLVNAYRTNVLRESSTGFSTIDSWSATTYRGAKYYISAKDQDTDEVSNVEALVVHDGTTAFVMPYNQLNTNAGDTPLITLGADITSGNVRLLASAPTSVNFTIRMYRLRLRDNETTSLGTYTKVLAPVTVTSSETTLDEFSSVGNVDSSQAYVACNYFVTAYNATEGTASAYDVYVASDGVVAAVSSSFVSSKSNPMLTFLAEHTNGVVTLSAHSNSGGNTTVNAYRWQLPKPAAVDPFKIVDSWNKTIYRGAKYFMTIMATNLGEHNAQEVAVVHNSSDAFNTVYNLITTGNTYPQGLISISTDVQGNLVRVKATSNGEAVLKITMVRHRTLV